MSDTQYFFQPTPVSSTDHPFLQFLEKVLVELKVGTTVTTPKKDEFGNTVRGYLFIDSVGALICKRIEDEKVLPVIVRKGTKDQECFERYSGEDSCKPLPCYDRDPTTVM